MTAQALYLITALLSLGAYGALSRGWVTAKSPSYLWTNLVAGSVGAASSLMLGLWGALLLNGMWAIIAGWGLWRR